MVECFDARQPSRTHGEPDRHLDTAGADGGKDFAAASGRLLGRGGCPGDFAASPFNAGALACAVAAFLVVLAPESGDAPAHLYRTLLVREGVLVWDNLGGHTSTAMRALIASRPWLRVYALPAYAPELNPVEKVWSHLKRGLANLAAGTVTNLATLAKTRLKKMQYTHGLVDGFFTGTGLSPP